MCIFCGGRCGGTGDVLLPFIGIGMPFLISKARLRFYKVKSWVKNCLLPVGHAHVNISRIVKDKHRHG